MTSLKPGSTEWVRAMQDRVMDWIMDDHRYRQFVKRLRFRPCTAYLPLPKDAP